MMERQGTLKEHGIGLKCEWSRFLLLNLLCCPVFTPQITGATVDAPPTIKVSVQVPAVGPAVVKETKSNLKLFRFNNVEHFHYPTIFY